MCHCSIRSVIVKFVPEVLLLLVRQYTIWYHPSPHLEAIYWCLLSNCTTNENSTRDWDMPGEFPMFTSSTASIDSCRTVISMEPLISLCHMNSDDPESEADSALDVWVWAYTSLAILLVEKRLHLCSGLPAGSGASRPPRSSWSRTLIICWTCT